jgi:hypothetical protein
MPVAYEITKGRIETYIRHIWYLLLLTAVRNVLYLDNSEKGKPFLHFHGNTEDFYIVESFNYAKFKKGRIFVFSWQQWLHECVSMYHGMYTVYVLLLFTIVLNHNRTELFKNVAKPRNSCVHYEAGYGR